MSTWAIGDIQGCYDSLRALLERLAFDPARDRLWLVGDLVNRGPRSLDVLRWVRAQGESVVNVLGNHDLHLLACAGGVMPPRKKDTLAAVLAAPDRDVLCDWLRRRPLLHRDGDFALVHAGLWPSWTLGRALALAAEVEAALMRDRWRDVLGVWRRPKSGRPAGWAARWHDGLEGDERLATLLDVFTRMRCLRDADGTFDHGFTGPPEERAAGSKPWYEVRRLAQGEGVSAVTIVFGHWAAQGLRQGSGWAALDSGCVWGGGLSAVCLEDGRIVRQPSVEGHV